MAMLNNQRVIIYLPFAYLQVRYRSHSPFRSMIFDDLQFWKNGDFPVHDAKYPKGTIHGSEPYRPFLRAETILDLIFLFCVSSANPYIGYSNEYLDTGRSSRPPM